MTMLPANMTLRAEHLQKLVQLLKLACFMLIVRWIRARYGLVGFKCEYYLLLPLSCSIAFHILWHR